LHFPPFFIKFKVMLRKIITEIEKEKFSFILGFLTLFSIILTRNIIESAFEGKQLLGFSEIVSHSFYMIFVHFPLFYISIFACILFVFRFLTKENIIKIAKVLLIGMTVIIIAPVIDIVISRGSGYNLTYLTGPGEFTEIHKFFYFTKDLLQASWGQRAEILLVLLGSFVYVFIKTRNYLKSIIAPIIIYLVIFIHGILPNTIAAIPSYLGFKNLTTTTILGSGLLPIDSQNYSVIFSISIISASLMIALISKKIAIKEIFNLRTYLISFFAIFLGILYGLFLTLKYYPSLLINPIFYLSVLLSILIAIFTNRISQLHINMTEFQILAVVILLFSLSLGYIFMLLILISYLFKRFLKPNWLSIIPLFIAGFSLIFQQDTFKTIIPTKSKNIELKGRKLAGWTCFLNGNYKKALLIYLKAHSISYDYEIQKRIGQCYLNMGDLEKGIEELKKIEYPDYETILSLGQAYTQNGKYTEAIAIYKKAIEEKISPSEFYVKIAQISSRRRTEEEMNAAIDKAALYGIPKYKLYQIKANFYFRKNDLENAAKMYDLSLIYNPRSAASLSGKGIIYYRQGNIKEAEEQILKALKIEPNDDAIYNNLGAIYIAESNYKMAEKVFLKSLRINPNQEESYYNLGLIYEVTGNKPEALQMYQKALNVNPEYLPAKIKIKVLQK
jgi:tetratricopeptide (TPR) repeat protein